MFVPSYLEMLQKAETQEDLAIIATKMASGEIKYAFPYQLKLLLIEYSKVTLKLMSKNVNTN